MNDDYQSYASLYRTALLEDVIPFWERHSIDREQGGYFTCLDRQGRVYDTDKFMWLQCRQVWTFAMLYSRVEKRDSWLGIARHGIDFLKRHGMDDDGSWYFSLDRSGLPLVQPYNIFSDCFAAMAFAQYASAAGDDGAAHIAQRTYRNILRRRENPKGRYSKAVPGTRPLKGLGLPMIACHLALEMEPVLARQEIDDALDDGVHNVMNVFYDSRRKVMFEYRAPDGSFADCMDGRLINPGHGIECLWFVMDIARRRGDAALTRQAADRILDILSQSWDEEHGGIFYFMDADGHPPQQLEWDQKLWWVHAETLIALAMAWADTGDAVFRDWYRRVRDYTWQRFPDPQYGEWFGYLNRRGEVLLPLKGGKWKGCYHVPRACYRLWREFEALARKAEA